jgi:GNAT superfamily N-acetyltransferase
MTDTIHEIEQNLWETWSVFGRGPGCTLHEDEDSLWLETPIPIVPYNGVLRFQVRDNADKKIDSIVEQFSTRKAQFMWIVHPSSSPADLRVRLQRRGLRDVEPIIGMVRELVDLPKPSALPSDIEIRTVADESDASAFYRFAEWRWNVPDEYADNYAAIAEGFRLGRPGSKAVMWQAWRSGQPISKAGLYFGSGAAGVYGVVTRPEARGLGLARSLTLAALHKARSCGYRTAVLHSTPMAERVYESLGFTTWAELRLFASEEVQI